MPYMNEDALDRLFEKFLLRYCKVHHSELNLSSPKIAWALGEEHSGIMLPAMQTDISLSSTSRFLIIDTKFYESMLQKQGRFSLKKNHFSNLYQIFSYVKKGIRLLSARQYRCAFLCLNPSNRTA